MFDDPVVKLLLRVLITLFVGELELQALLMFLAFLQDLVALALFEFILEGDAGHLAEDGIHDLLLPVHEIGPNFLQHGRP